MHVCIPRPYPLCIQPLCVQTARPNPHRPPQFNQAVKVRSIAIRSASEAQAPRTLRLVTNKPSLSFDDVEDGASVLQELELSADDVREGRRVPLRFVRFQSVNSLHVRSLPGIFSARCYVWCGVC